MHNCSSMQLTSQDKTPAVISRAMAKHNLEGEQAADYELVQVISEERGTTWPFEILLLEYIICLCLLWWNANITFTIFFPLFLQNWSSPTTPTCFTPWAHLQTLTSCCVCVVLRGGRFSCAVVAAPHYHAHSNAPVCPSGSARSHCDLWPFLDQNRLCKKTTAGGVLENGLYRLFQGEFIDFRNISELI